MPWTPHQSKRLGTSGQGVATAAIAAAPRRVRTSQPQTPVGIDWGNPLTRGLVFAGNQSTESMVGLSAVYSAAGRLTRASSTSSGGRVLPATNVGTSGTLFLVGYAPSTGSNEYLFNGETGTARDLFARIGSSGNYIWYSGGVEVADASPINAALWPSNTFAAVALKWTPSAQAAYRNGNSFASKSATLTTASSRAIRLYSRYNSVEGAASGGLSLFMQWNRALSDAEIRSLSDNPWQIFLPDTQKVWVPV